MAFDFKTHFAFAAELLELGQSKKDDATEVTISRLKALCRIGNITKGKIL